MKIKKSIIWIIVLFAAALVLFFMVFANNNKNITYKTSRAVIGNLQQTVSETGAVRASEEIDLSFLSGGDVKAIYTAIGNKVKAGQLLAELDKESLLIKKQETEASVKVAEANLNKLLAGATTENRKISEAGVKQAKTSYEASVKEYDRVKSSQQEAVSQAEKNLSDLQDSSALSVTTQEQAIATAKTTLQNTKETYQQVIDNSKEDYIVVLDDKIAVANTALDEVDTIVNYNDLENKFSIKDLQYKANTELGYSQAVSLLNTARSNLSNAKLDNSNENASLAINSTLEALNKTFYTLDNCYKALENSIYGGTYTQTELDNHKSTVSAQQTLVSTAISAVQTVKQGLDTAILNYNTNVSNAENSLAAAQASYDNAVLTAKNALSSAKLNRDQQLIAYQNKVDNTFEAWQLAQRQYEQVIAPPNRHDVSLSQAQLSQAQASLAAINRQIEDMSLKSPIDGVVTKIDIEVGEQAVAGRAIISILAEETFEIEVLISEADIAKVGLKDWAEITMDAFGDDVIFYGDVSFIEPAETIIQDVIYYKVTINFHSAENQPNQEKYKEIRSGMTANITLTTDFRENVLIVPSRAIIDRNGEGKFIRVLKNNQLKEFKVGVGLRGDDGLTEIKSGISEGAEVVTKIIEE